MRFKNKSCAPQTLYKKILKQKYFYTDIRCGVLQIFLSIALFIGCVYIENIDLFSIKSEFLSFAKTALIQIAKILVPVYIVEVLRWLDKQRHCYYHYWSCIDAAFKMIADIAPEVHRPKYNAYKITEELRSYKRNELSFAFCYSTNYGMHFFDVFYLRLCNCFDSYSKLNIAYFLTTSDKEQLFEDFNEDYKYIVENKMLRFPNESDIAKTLQDMERIAIQCRDTKCIVEPYRANEGGGVDGRIIATNSK